MRGLVSGVRLALPDACRQRQGEEIERVLTFGLSAVVCVRLDDPEYGRPTKDRLSSPRVATIVECCIAEPFAAYLRSEPTLLARIADGLRGDADRERG